MVSTSPSSTKSDWRTRQGAKRTTTSARWSRRVFLTLLVAGLAVALAWMLWPDQFPGTRVVVISMVHYDAIVPPTADGLRDDGGLKQSWSADHVRLVREPRLGTYAGMPSLPNFLSVDRGDVLVLYVCGHGVSDNGKAYVLCTDVARRGAAGNQELLRYPIDVLLDAIRDCPARRKLLILDMTHLDGDPWLGMFSNQFPHLLEEKLRGLNDSRLWVLAAAGPLEHSAIDYAARQSAFSRFVEEGLRRAADRDGDGLIELDELVDYVRDGMAAWRVRQPGRAVQTPLLWYCGQEQSSASSGPSRPTRPPHEVLLVLSKPPAHPQQEEKQEAKPDDDAKKALKARDDTAAALQQAWSERDGERPIETAALERWSPIDYAPHLWRWSEDQLLACEWRWCLDQNAREAIEQLAASRPRRLIAAEKEAFLAGATAKSFADAPDEAEPLATAIRLRNRALYAAVDYVRWHAAASRASSAPLAWHDELFSVLAKELPALEQAIEPLEDGPALVPGSVDLESQLRRVQDAAGSLEKGLRTLREKGLESEVRRAKSEPGRIEPLLKTPLLAAVERMTLVRMLTRPAASPSPTAAGTSSRLAVDGTSTQPTLAHTRWIWDRLAEQAELEIQLVHLADPDFPFGVAPQDLRAAPTPEQEKRRWGKLEELGADLKRFYTSIPERIEKDIASGDRGALRRAAKLLRLVDLRDAARIGPEYRQIAVRPLHFASRPRLEVRSPETVPLRRDGAASTVELALAAPGSDAVESWLTLGYNPAELAIEDADGQTAVASQIRTKEILPAGGKMLHLSVRPVEARSMASFKLSVRLEAPGMTPAVAETTFQVPAEDKIDLVIQRSMEQGNVEQPRQRLANDAAELIVGDVFPNRTTQYALALKNHSGKPRKVSVEAFLVPLRLNVRGEARLGPADAAGMPLLGFERLAGPVGVELPADENALTRVPFEPPEKKAAAEPAAKDSGKAAKKPEPAAKEAAKDKEKDAAKEVVEARAMPNGLVVLVRDAEDKSKQWKTWIDFPVLSPARYVAPTVGFRLEDRRIHIRVLPRDEKLLPPLAGKPITVAWDIDRLFPPGFAWKKTGWKTAGQIAEPVGAAELSAEVPPDAKVGRVWLSVDDYPRAFAYDIRCDRDQDRVEANDDLCQVRIIAPRQDDVLDVAPGSPPIFLQVEVNASSDAFYARPGDRLRFWCRREGSAQVAWQRVFHDRRSVKQAARIGAEGQLLVDSQVSDFKIELPLANIQEKMELGAELLLPDLDPARQRSETRVRVYLDSEPPEISAVDANETDEGDLRVVTKLADFSGIKKVELAIDKEKPAAEKSFPLGQFDAEWEHVLAAKDLKIPPERPFQLVVKATDYAGHVKQMEQSLALKRRPPPPDPAKITKTIQGEVVSGTSESCRQIEVRLEGQGVQRSADMDDSRFTFSDLPLGVYTLVAKGQVGAATEPFTKSVKVDLTKEKGPTANVIIRLK